MIDLNEGYPEHYLQDVSLKRLIDELNLSTDEILLRKEPTKSMRRTHRTIVNEICYRLNTLLGD